MEVTSAGNERDWQRALYVTYHDAGVFGIVLLRRPEYLTGSARSC